jgi:LmbE family N-acetylglucosaminyl deacetylase
MSAPESRPVFLSPHYDDAALSCGGTLAAMADNGERPLVLTVFGGEPDGPLSDFALNMHRDWGLEPSEAIAHRRSEETRAAEILGVETRWLDLPDAIYRGERYLSDDELFGAVHPREATFYRQILAEIERYLDDHQINPDPLYCPLGVGNHVDHQLILATARTLTYRGQTVVAYEDYPYAGDPDAEVEKIAARRSGKNPIVRRLSDEHLDRRIAAIMCYASQHDVIFRFQGSEPASATRAYAERIGCGSPAERFWPL